MIDFVYRSDSSTRRSARELDDEYLRWAAPLDANAPVFRPVDGQVPVNDPTLSGENIDYIVEQFIARLKTPGAQISAPALQRLVSTITEMVNALAGGLPQSGAAQSAPVDTSWIPGRILDADGSTAESASSWGTDEAEASFAPAEEFAVFNPDDEQGFPEFEANDNLFSESGNEALISFDQSAFAPGELFAADQEPILFSAPPAQPAPRGIPISFLREEDENGEEIELPEAPTLYNFIMGFDDFETAATF
jgi:hypothetical protein